MSKVKQTTKGRGAFQNASIVPALDSNVKDIREALLTRRCFPNEASLLRRASAVLVETDEQWQTGIRYLTF